MGRFSKLETGQSSDAAPRDAIESSVTPLSGEGPATFEAVMRDADLAFYLGEWKKSLQLYSRALQFDNARPDPWVGQVLALIFLNQQREATVWAKRAREGFPEDPICTSLQAVTFAIQGTVTRGLATSDYAMERGAGLPLCWLFRAWILLEAGNSNWEFCMGKIRETAPRDDWRLEALMGLVLQDYRKWSQALDAWREAAAQAPKNHFLWVHIGVCCGRLGLASKGVEALQTALDIRPRYEPAEAELRRLKGLPIATFIARLRSIFSRLGKRHAE